MKPIVLFPGNENQTANLTQLALVGFYGTRLVTSVLAVVVTKARSQSPTLKGHWALVTSLDLGNVSGAQINEGTAHNLSASFERVWSSLDLSPFTFTFTCRRRAFVRAPSAFLRCKLCKRLDEESSNTCYVQLKNTSSNNIYLELQ